MGMSKQPYIKGDEKKGIGTCLIYDKTTDSSQKPIKAADVLFLREVSGKPTSLVAIMKPVYKK